MKDVGEPRLQGERHMDDIALPPLRHRQATSTEDVEHRLVFCENMSLKTSHPNRSGYPYHMFQQDTCNATAMVSIVNQECQFCDFPRIGFLGNKASSTNEDFSLVRRCCN